MKKKRAIIPMSKKTGERLESRIRELNKPESEGFLIMLQNILLFVLCAVLSQLLIKGHLYCSFSF